MGINAPIKPCGDDSSCKECKDDLDGYVKLEGWAKGSSLNYTAIITLPIGSCTVKEGCHWNFRDFSINFSKNHNTTIAAEVGIKGEGGFSGDIILK